MANRFLNNIKINDSYTLPTADGAENQIIVTDGAGNLSFDDLNTVTQSITGVQSNFTYYEVKNSSGAAIGEFKAVRAVGTDGNSGHILIDEMVADGSVEARYFLGITMDGGIANGGIGRVVAFGEIDQINTSGFTDGDVLWCDPANDGDFTTTEPSGPNLKIPAAIVLNSATNGKIQVRVQANEGLHQLHDVNITSQADDDLLQWNSTAGVWENKTLASIADSRYVNTAGDTMTGNLIIQKTNPLLRLVDNNTSTGDYPAIEFETSNSQGVRLEHNEFDSELPIGGYGLILKESAANTQFPSTGALSLSVLGEIYAGATTVGSLNKVFHDGYHPNADKWTVARTITLTGDLTGSVSLDGSANVNLSASVVNDSHTHDGRYVQLAGDTMTGDLTVGSGSADNYVRSYFNDGSYTEMRGYGLQFGRNTSYIRPTADNTKTLYLGSSTAQWNALSIDASTTTFNVNGSEKMRVTSGGDVGIGTDNPGQKLEVEGNIRLSKSNDVTSGFELGRDGSTLDAFIIQRENADLFFRTNNAERMRIDSLGQVGIGDTAPDATLTVFRTSTTFATALTTAESRAGLSVKSTSTYDAKLTISTGTSGVQQLQGVNNAATTGRDIAINPYGGNVGIGRAPGAKLDVSGNVRAVNYYCTGGYFIFGTSSAEGEYIYRTGNDVRIYAGGSAGLTVDGDNNRVGIGTTSPDSLLHLQSTGPAELIIEADTDNVTETDNARIILKQDGGAVIGRLGYRDNTNSLEFINQYAEALYLGTNNNTDLTILSSGSVGIGTDNPQSKLHVANGTLRTWTPTSGTTAIFESTANSRSFITITGTNEAELWFGDGTTQTKGRVRYENNNDMMEFWTGANARMYINSSGAVGIGVPSPAETLDVSGSIKATGTIWVGYDANIANSISCSNWFRSSGTTGWFNASYGGGIYMTDTTNVTVYNSKAFRVNNTGTLSIRSAGDIVAYYSDERLKTNLGNITNAVDKVKKLNGFYYTNNDLAQEFGYTEEQVQVGVSAQEVENVMPEVVKPAPFDLGVNEDGSTYSISGDDYKTVKYEKLVPLLIEAIKEQQKQIDKLKSQLNAFTK